MEMENIIKLIKAVSESSLTSFEYEENGTRLSFQINRSIPAGSVTQTVVETYQLTNQTESPCPSSDLTICSPMVGTFYSAKAEGSEPFISVGDVVKKGQVIGIVEAMKLMNEIESEYDGVVEAILVKNKEMVEYGQSLVSLRPL